MLKQQDQVKSFKDSFFKFCLISSLEGSLNSLSKWPPVDDEVFKVKNVDGCMLQYLLSQL